MSEWSEKISALLKGRDAPKAAAPDRDQLLYTKGYEEGLREGMKRTIEKIINALILVVDEGNGSDAEKTVPGETPLFLHTSPPAHPLLNIPTPPSNNCTACGHSIERHHPLYAKACFADGCKCVGFNEKPRR